MPVIFISTPRFFLREIIPDDAAAMLEMDSDPEVHAYLGKRPVTSVGEIQSVIANIRSQYNRNGIGRWAVITRSTNEFVGWAGLKLIEEQINEHVNHYDLGYRFLKKYWGRGYASECAAAVRDYGLYVLKQPKLYAYTDSKHLASKKVLQRTGFEYVNSFRHEGDTCDWFSVRA